MEKIVWEKIIFNNDMTINIKFHRIKVILLIFLIFSILLYKYSIIWIIHKLYNLN